MKFLEQLLSYGVLERLGWTLVHSIWQGLLIGLFAGALLLLLRRYAARTRYFILYSSLLLVLVSSLVTFFALPGDKALISNDAGIFQAEAARVNGLQQDTLKSTGENELTITGLWAKFAAALHVHTPLLALLWFIGSLFFAMRFAGSLFYLNRIRSKGLSNAGWQWTGTVDRLARQLGIKKRVGIKESGFVKVPVIIGNLKPLILVPFGMISNVPPQQLEILLFHELMHVRRRDYLFNLVQSVIEVFFFYHPVVWWLSREIRIEREHICDDEVLSCYDKYDYARALAIAQEWELNPPALAAAIASERSLLINRIKRMMKTNYLKKGYAEGMLSVLVMVIGIFTLTASAAISFGPQDEDLVNENFTGGLTAASQVSPDYQDETATVHFVKWTDLNTAVENEVKQLPVNASGSAIYSAPPDTTELSGEQKAILEKEMERARQEIERARQEVERAMEQQQQARKELQEALQQQQELLREQHEEFEQQIRETVEDIQIDIGKDIRIGGDSIRAWVYKYRTDSAGPGGHRFFFHGDVFPDDFQYEYRYDVDELREKLEEQKHLYKEYGKKIEKDIDLYVRRHVPKGNEFYRWHPDPEFSRTKTEQIIRQELIDAGLIERHGSYVIELTDRQMLINGEKQSRSVYQKYKRLYESMEDQEITGNFRYKLVF